jgi:hypothetical protein
MSTSIVAIKAAIYEMGLLFNQQPNDERISAYAKALANFTPDQIKFAFNEVIKSGSAFFPSLAEILSHLAPKEPTIEERAPVIVAEMFKLINQFSQYRELEMLEAASEDARLAFLAMGGTFNFRMSENVDMVRAQTERLVKGVLASKETAKHIEQLNRIGVYPKVKLIEPNGMKALDYSEFKA